jgi:hypothetical protein
MTSEIIKEFIFSLEFCVTQILGRVDRSWIVYEPYQSTSLRPDEFSLE